MSPVVEVTDSHTQQKGECLGGCHVKGEGEHDGKGHGAAKSR